MLASALPTVLAQARPTWAEFVAAWELFRDPIITAVAAGVVLGFLSVYIVLRRMVFVSAGITQASGLGIAAAFYSTIHLGFAFDPVWGAILFALLASLLFVIEPERLHLTREALLGLVFALAGGATVMLGDRISQEAHDIQAILFGTGVLVRRLDRDLVLIVGAAVLTLHIWWFRGLSFVSFDRTAAAVQGLPVRLLNAVTFITIGAMVGVAARALGSLPVFALSTLPAIGVTSLGIANLRLTFALAALLGLIAALGGYMYAFFRLFPVGASQTVMAATLVVICLVIRAGARLVRRVAR